MMKRRQIIISVLLVAVFVFALTACGGSKSPIVGKWVGTLDGSETVWTFKSNGKCEGGNGLMNLSGTYTFDESTRIVQAELSILGVPIPYEFEMNAAGTEIESTEDYGDWVMTKK